MSVRDAIRSESQNWMTYVKLKSKLSNEGHLQNHIQYIDDNYRYYVNAIRSTIIDHTAKYIVRNFFNQAHE